MSTHVPPEIGKGYKKGGVLFVGRDPGTNEAIQGRPFVGESGTVFDLAITEAGFWRERVAITNRVPEKPWANEFHRHSRKAVDDGWKDLSDLVDRIEPGLIVAMGNEACYDLVPGWKDLSGPNSGGSSIFKAKGIMDRRGFMWPESTLGPPILATLHPANVVYQEMPSRLLLEWDMVKAKQFWDGDRPIEEWPVVTFAHTQVETSELLGGSEVVAFDIETHQHNRLLCIAFCGEKLRPVVMFAKDFDLAKRILENPNQKKLAHHGQYDTYFLKYLMGSRSTEVTPFAHDTQAMWWAMYPELAGKKDTGREEYVKGGRFTRKSLLFLASIYLNVGWWKDYSGSREKMAILCARDAWVTRKLFDAMHGYLETLGVETQYRNTMDLMGVLNQIQNVGLLVDDKRRMERRRKLKKRATKEVKASREATTSFLKQHGIKDPLWYKDKQCPCCGGGAKKAAQCWSCAGFDRSPTKKMLELKFGCPPGATKDVLMESFLGECKECGGKGTTPTWDFNPFSPPQMTKLLYDVLDVPRSTIIGKSPNATEHTLRRVEKWATD